MSPTEFMNEYREMAVIIEPGHSLQIDVHAYLINHPGRHSAVKALAMWETIKDELQSQLLDQKSFDSGQLVVTGGVHALRGGGKGFQVPAHRHATAAAETDLHHQERAVRWVPYGKGSPEAVRQYLKLAVKSGATTAAKLQRFTDDRYVGLDCSGFVSNYMVAIGKMKPALVAESNARSFSIGHTQRKSTDDLSPLDIMVWEDGTHVAILEDVECATRGTVSTVVESNGHRGLGGEQYSFLSMDKNGTFTVERENGSQWKVHVFDWGL